MLWKVMFLFPFGKIVSIKHVSCEVFLSIQKGMKEMEENDPLATQEPCLAEQGEVILKYAVVGDCWLLAFSPSIFTPENFECTSTVNFPNELAT